MDDSQFPKDGMDLRGKRVLSLPAANSLAFLAATFAGRRLWRMYFG